MEQFLHLKPGRGPILVHDSETFPATDIDTQTQAVGSGLRDEAALGSGACLPSRRAAPAAGSNMSVESTGGLHQRSRDNTIDFIIWKFKNV